MKRNIIVIGASAGGVEAVPLLLSSIRRDIPAAFFVTLHIPSYSVSYMPRLIAREGGLQAEHARSRMPIRPGMVYVAPPDYHLILGADVIRLSHGPKENRHRPAIDPMFRSAARMYGDRVAGVLLTGMLDDGVSGLQAIQQAGGLTIVQDPREASHPEMPRNALEAFKPDHVLSLKQIEELLARLPISSFREATMKSGKRRSNKAQSFEPIAVIPSNGKPMAFVCPECQGPLWELRDGGLVRYQCLVGHRYSQESLLAAHSEELEAALWIALRAIEERVALQMNLVAHSRAAGHLRGEQAFQARLTESRRHARLLREILEKMGNRTQS